MKLIDYTGFSDSELGGNDYKTPITGQLKQETYAGYKRLLNAEGRVLHLNFFCYIK